MIGLPFSEILTRDMKYLYLRLNLGKQYPVLTPMED